MNMLHQCQQFGWLEYWLRSRLVMPYIARDQVLHATPGSSHHLNTVFQVWVRQIERLLNDCLIPRRD